MGGLPLGVPEPPPPYIPYVPPKEDAELVASCAAVLKKNPKQINALSDQEAVLFSREIMEGAPAHSSKTWEIYVHAVKCQ